MDFLLDQFKKIKEEADRLLADSSLVDLLSSYGEVIVGGSYSLDVMLRPDLDMYVICEQHDESKALQVMNTIITSHYFDSVWFVDWLHKESDKIKGYYLQPHKKLGDNNWKLDIWLITRDQYKPVAPAFKELLDNNERKKELIIKIKDAYKKGTKYREGIDGNFIYEAVLNKNITSIDEFEEYRKTNIF